MLNIYFRNITAVLFLFSMGSVFAQSNVEVRTTKEFLNALKNAKPGTRIILSDGEYNLGGDLKISNKATKNKPIIIRAKNLGIAKIIGESHMILTAAEHIIIEGLNFESTNGPAIELRGSNNIQITRNVFHLKETKRGSWIHIDDREKDIVRLSHHNRIDHNIFENKSQLGNFIAIDGVQRPQPQVSQYNRIDHNLFKDIGPRVENVLEAIRAGSSEFTLTSGFNVIEENLFERCDGDPEYISIKACDNIIRHNTFRECLGSLSLRHGNRNTVEGNYILGNGRTGSFLDSTGKTWTLGTGGVRFVGDDMKIINNYFEGLTGTKWDGTFVVPNGDADYGDGQSLTKHFRIRKALIAFNTLVNNKSGMEIGYNGDGFQGNWWYKPPVEVVFANNIIVGSTDTLVKLFTEPQACTWIGNIVFAEKEAVVATRHIDGVEIVDPKLKQIDGVWKIAAESPAINAAQGKFPKISRDIEMKRRKAVKDVGAFEVTKGKIKNGPLTAKDVGPLAH